MTDFDFDELDKAVNNALTGTSTPAAQPQPKVVETPTPEVVADEPAPVVAAPVSATPVVTSAPAARRSAGRFMDMVHPSSDMRTQTTGDTSGANPTVPQATQGKAAFPDIYPVEPLQAAETPQTISELPLTLEDDWSKPLESPFLPDTKVEKRPLGGEAPTAVNFDPEELLEAPDDPRLDAHTMPDPIEFAQQAPEEVSQEAPTQPEPEQTAEEDAPLPLPELKMHEEPEEVKPVPDGAYGAGSFQPAEAEPAGPASITQQYQEKPAAPVETGAIYDTEAYHQPLTHAPKKSAGIWAVVWIVLLIALGGAAGAGVYFFVLPML
jgi:hypothetical protein